MSTRPGTEGGTGQLIVVCGAPGVGKTTVARAIAEHLDGDVLRTDVVRKELFDEPEYTAAEERRVYEEILSRAREAVEAGDAVVLDGTFYRQRYRRDAVAVADDAAARFARVSVDCEREVVRARMAVREDDASDADFEVHEMFRERFEPFERDHLEVDNSGDLESTRRQVARRFGAVEETV